MVIRPLTSDDVEAAAAVMLAALPIPAEYDDGHRRGWLQRRTLHLLRTDPGGCWAAEDGGELAGVALALVRDGIWGLSMLAVHPDRHARGAGGQRYVSFTYRVRNSTAAPLNNLTMLLVSRAGSDVKTIGDLRGKRVGIWPGSTQEVFILERLSGQRSIPRVEGEPIAGDAVWAFTEHCGCISGAGLRHAGGDTSTSEAARIGVLVVEVRHQAQLSALSHGVTDQSEPAR